ncbi:MAG: hypothetical protein E7168_04985 [Firmicutes bacterium]|nr:hypothetical protein [Bacillota bacterium]
MKTRLKWLNEVLVKELELEENPQYLDEVFCYGGCYVYAQILETIFNGQIFINLNQEHCITKIENDYYDITGKVKSISGFIPMDEKLKRYAIENYGLDDEIQNQRIVNDTVTEYKKVYKRRLYESNNH